MSRVRQARRRAAAKVKWDRRSTTGLEGVVGTSAGRRYASKEMRSKILERDGWRCRYCGVQVTDATANIDHVVAWPYGLSVKLNMVTSCGPCNQAKGTMYVIPRALPGDRYYRLHRAEPVQPTTHSRRPGHVIARVHARAIRDPWIREGPQRGDF